MALTNKPLSDSGYEFTYLFKVLVVGDIGTGKTSLIKRLVHNIFSQHYKATIGVDFALTSVEWDPNTLVRVQLWDIAGQERFGNMTRVYYREASGIIIVYDVTRTSTFEAVLKWKKDVDSKVTLRNGKPLPVILFANKVDLQSDQDYLLIDMDKFCKENGFINCFRTSAKNPEMSEAKEGFRALVSELLKNNAEIEGLQNVNFNQDNVKTVTLVEGTQENKPDCC